MVLPQCALPPCARLPPPCRRRAAVVAENPLATAYVQLEQLGEVLKGLGAKTQTFVNSETDVVILADVERENEWDFSKKGSTLKEQLALGDERKKPLEVLSFPEAMARYGIRPACEARSVVARFDTHLPPPGPARTRGQCFGRTLVMAGVHGFSKVRRRQRRRRQLCARARRAALTRRAAGRRDCGGRSGVLHYPIPPCPLSASHHKKTGPLLLILPLATAARSSNGRLARSAGDARPP